MRAVLPLLLVLAAGCGGQEQTTTSTTTSSSPERGTSTLPAPLPTEPAHDTVIVIHDQRDTLVVAPAPAKTYANARFKDVQVSKTGDQRYEVSGRAQVFEASLSWVVEDGHEELKQGHETTDAGAPEWGAFRFTLEVAKKRPASTLHLVLYEASAKDGSRQHQLPIPLP